MGPATFGESASRCDRNVTERTMDATPATSCGAKRVPWTCRHEQAHGTDALVNFLTHEGEPQAC